MTRTRALFLAKVAVSVALLTFLLTFVELESLWDLLSGIDPRYLAAGFGLLVLQSCFSTTKWRLLLKADGIVMPWFFLWRTYLIGNFISLFLPTSFGGDVYRVFAVKEVNKNLLKSTSSVMFDRLTGLFALLTIAMVGYLVLPQGRYGLLALAVYLAGVLCFCALVSERATERVRRLSNKLAKLLSSFRHYMRSPAVLASALLIAFCFQFNIVFTNWVYAGALNIEIGLGMMAAIIPLAYATEMLPISINGLGVRESAYMFFFVMVGLTKEEGFAVALMAVSMRYAFSLLGGLLLLLTVLRRRAPNTAASS